MITIFVTLPEWVAWLWFTLITSSLVFFMGALVFLSLARIFLILQVRNLNMYEFFFQPTGFKNLNYSLVYKLICICLATLSLLYAIVVSAKFYASESGDLNL